MVLSAREVIMFDNCGLLRVYFFDAFLLSFLVVCTFRRLCIFVPAHSQDRGTTTSVILPREEGDHLALSLVPWMHIAFLLPPHKHRKM